MSIKSEKDHLEEFFGVDVEMPEVERTWGVPELTGENHSVLRTNPLASGMAVHEMRHKVHRDVVEYVVSGQVEEVENFFEEELKGLDIPSEFKGVPTSYYSAKMKFGNDNVSEYLTEDNLQFQNPDEVFDLRNSWEDDELTELIFWKNYKTDIQPEIFAEDSETSIAALSGTGSMLNGLTSLVGAYGLASGQATNVPEIAAVSALTAGTFTAAYFLGKDAYLASKPESLTEENLEKLDSKEDRRRAMLYNSNVDDSLDEFLDTLDEYNIQGY